jgi:sigma-54 dependent transcriptional regulator, flagellar regulatory protein
VAAPPATARPFVDFPAQGLDLPEYMSALERDMIHMALERTGGNKNKASELLRIKRTTLVEKLKRLEGLQH